jgi:quercetin dioxygenase-like cupin family protein
VKFRRSGPLNGKFVTRKSVRRQRLVWGDHKHPRQEEVIYVIAGEIEQWLGKRRRVLRAGESVFIPKNTVHASFNVSKRSAILLAALGPCAGKEGYELIEDSRPRRPGLTRRRRHRGREARRCS